MRHTTERGTGGHRWAPARQQDDALTARADCVAVDVPAPASTARRRKVGVTNSLCTGHPCLLEPDSASNPLPPKLFWSPVDFFPSLDRRAATRQNALQSPNTLHVLTTDIVLLIDMAKGLRASTERANRRKLRANVFGPAEKARAERLHAKLLATIQSEKPAPPEKKAMDVDEDGAPLSHLFLTSQTNVQAATAEAKDDLSKGSLFLTAPIPSSLLSSSTTNPACEERDMRNFCFYLGLSSDIAGFASSGHLKLAFDPLPPHQPCKNQGLTSTS